MWSWDIIYAKASNYLHKQYAIFITRPSDQCGYCGSHMISREISRERDREVHSSEAVRCQGSYSHRLLSNKKYLCGLTFVHFVHQQWECKTWAILKPLFKIIYLFLVQSENCANLNIAQISISCMCTEISPHKHFQVYSKML